MDYKVLEIPAFLERPYTEMSKEGAIVFFDWLNKIVGERMIQLDSLTRGALKNTTLDFSAESLLPLGFWLRDNLKLRKRTEDEIWEKVERAPSWLKESIESRDEVLDELSLSIVFDMAIYFSQVLIKVDERISWKMHTKASKLDVNRNQLVLTGTTEWLCNPVRSMEIMCFGIAKGKKKTTRLRELHETCINNLIA